MAIKYDRIVFQKFAYDPKIETDYPGAVAECEKSTLEAVIAKKTFASAIKDAGSTKSSGTLLFTAQVTSLRIVGSAARMWGGAFAGSSDMTLRIKLIDAATGTIVREKELSTNNNPWAAAWTGGGSDRSLPTDLGRMVAEYLAAIQPQTTVIKSAASPAGVKMSGEATAPGPTPAAAAAAEKPAQPAAPPQGTAKLLLITKTATVRAEPNTKGKIRGTLRKGDKVESLGKSGSWFNIKSSKGITGWVHDSLATEQK